jgi:hypothetical protein
VCRPIALTLSFRRFTSKPISDDFKGLSLRFNLRRRPVRDLFPSSKSTSSRIYWLENAMIQPRSDGSSAPLSAREPRLARNSLSCPDLSLSVGMKNRFPSR